MSLVIFPVINVVFVVFIALYSLTAKKPPSYEITLIPDTEFGLHGHHVKPYGIGSIGSAPDMLTACFSFSAPFDAERVAQPVKIATGIVAPWDAVSTCVRSSARWQHHIMLASKRTLIQHGMNHSAAHLDNLHHARRNQVVFTASNDRVHLRSFRSGNVMLLLRARRQHWVIGIVSTHDGLCFA